MPGTTDGRGDGRSKKKDFCCERFSKGCSPEAATELARIAAAKKPRDMTGKLAQSAERLILRDPTKDNRDVAPGVNASFLISASAASPATATLPALPGIAFLGRGYNMLTGNIISTITTVDHGYSLPVFQFEYSKGLTTPDGKYQMPDGTTVMSVPECNYDMDGRTVNSLWAYQDNVNSFFGLSGTAGPVNFKFGIDSEQIHDATSSGSNIYLTNQIQCTVLQVQIEPYVPPALNDDFVTAVNDFLPNVSDSEAYNNFLDQFGTSFISMAKLGGRQGFQTKFSTSSYADLLENQVDVQASVGADNYATLGLNTNSTLAHNENVTSAILQSSRFNLGAPFSSKIDEYQASVLADPVPIFLTTQPISDLLSPPYWSNPSADVKAKQSLIKAASADYCTHIGEIKNYSNPCEAPKPVPPFTVPPMPANAVHSICITNHGAFRLYCTVFILGPGLNKYYPPQTRTEYFDAGHNQCVPGEQLGAKIGDWLNCECHAEAGHTVQCGGAWPWYEVSPMYGQIDCSGTTLDIHCPQMGISKSNGPL